MKLSEQIKQQMECARLFAGAPWADVLIGQLLWILRGVQKLERELEKQNKKGARK